MTKKSYGVDASGKAMRTQVAVIRNYLMEGKHNRVSQKFVADRWGFTRLSAIIYLLKDDPEREGGEYAVFDQRMSVLNRFGNITHPKEYWIEKVA